MADPLALRKPGKKRQVPTDAARSVVGPIAAAFASSLACAPFAASGAFDSVVFSAGQAGPDRCGCLFCVALAMRDTLRS